jgi:hypothetical protein
MLTTLAAVVSGQGAADGRRPTYTADGRLEVPPGFRSWVFAGVDLSPRYRTEAELAGPEKPRKTRQDGRPAGEDTFHAVYINPEAYEAYRKTGRFPDPTVLVMEVFRAEERDPGGVLADGLFPGKRVGVEAAVKDGKRPGGGVPWAYYDFALDGAGKPAGPAKARPDRDCYDCHLRHASKDNVWVQFYPTLRDPE